MYNSNNIIITIQLRWCGIVQCMLWAYNVTKWRKGIAREELYSRPWLNSKAIGLAIDSGIATLEFVQEFLTECQLAKSEYMYMYVYCTCMCVRACECPRKLSLCVIGHR